MTSQQGQFAWQAKRATGIANSVEANERRREPAIINWDKAIANLLDILNEEPTHVADRGRPAAPS